jgi:hypothetical protein
MKTSLKLTPRNAAAIAQYAELAGMTAQEFLNADRGSGSGRHELYFPAAFARPNDPAKVVT